MSSSHEQQLRSILITLKAPARGKNDDRGGHPPIPRGVRFVTISRQAGSGGKSLGDELVKAINHRQPKNTIWYAWEKALVDKVAEDGQIGSQFVEALEDADHRWLSELASSLSLGDHPSDLKVFRRVASTIRALASAGSAVIVGRGAVFVTAGLPGGLHLRLVAPVEFRIEQMAKRLNVSLADAAMQVHEIDRNRTAFCHRYWPTKTIAPEAFTLTFNTAELTESQMIACLLPLALGDGVNEPTSSTHLAHKQV